MTDAAPNDRSVARMLYGSKYNNLGEKMTATNCGQRKAVNINAKYRFSSTLSNLDIGQSSNDRRR